MKKAISIILIIITLFTVTSCGDRYYSETIPFDEGETRLIAHRGLSGIELENTNEAFIAAGERSYYGIEADVRRTSDGRYVMCHDADLVKMAGRAVRVEEMTLAELEAITLKAVRPDAKPPTLATLESYISICKRYEKVAVLEYKSSFSEAEIKEIIDIIIALDYTEGVNIISFSLNDLITTRSYLEGAPLTYLSSSLNDDVYELLETHGFIAGLNHKVLDEAVVDDLHERGIEISAWTIDDIGRARTLALWGVDYITTNILE